MLQLYTVNFTGFRALTLIFQCEEWKNKVGNGQEVQICFLFPLVPIIILCFDIPYINMHK